MASQPASKREQRNRRIKMGELIRDVAITAFLVLCLSAAVVKAFETKTIITYDLIAPDGSVWVAKEIVGGEPVQMYPIDGWSVKVRSIETR